MKLMKDMNQDELIEVIAAVFLRVWGFIYALTAFHYLSNLWSYLGRNSNSLARTGISNSSTVNGYFVDITFYVLLSAVMFLLTVPLARLLCRGLSHALDLKVAEKSTPS